MTSSVEAVFDRKPSAPAWIDSSTVSSSSWAVSMITGVFGQRALTARVTSAPVPSGRAKSIRTTSTGSRRRFRASAAE